MCDHPVAAGVISWPGWWSLLETSGRAQFVRRKQAPGAPPGLQPAQQGPGLLLQPLWACAQARLPTGVRWQGGQLRGGGGYAGGT